MSEARSGATRPAVPPTATPSARPVARSSGAVTDADLIAGLGAGDEQAARHLYERYAGHVTAVAMSVLRDEVLAAEALQRTFVSAWRAAGTFDPSLRIGPWLCAIARHAAIDVWREQRRLVPLRDDESDVPVLPTGLDEAWEAWQVRLALAELPDDDRALLAVLHGEGLTQREAAARLGIPIGTVKSRSSRAHRRLARLLRHLVEVTR